MNVICQFSTRDSRNPEKSTNGKKKILPAPKDFNLLSKLADRMQGADHQAIQSYALSLIERVENEDDPEMTVDQAVDDLTAFEKRTKWVETVDRLLEEQAKKLPLEKYSGEGADRGHKDDLNTTLAPLRKIMNI
jgi:hypothetical protein